MRVINDLIVLFLHAVYRDCLVMVMVGGKICLVSTRTLSVVLKMLHPSCATMSDT
jgi:hypothetical protein